MTIPWYLSCPHGCSDMETCPYGRKYLLQIRALLHELVEKRAKVDEIKKKELDGLLSEKSALTGRVLELQKIAQDAGLSVARKKSV